MPATIAELLRGKSELVTAKADDRLKDVLAVMIKHDYSQLPVIDAADRPIGLITCDSIVRALHNFGVSTETLSVKDAMLRRPPTYYPSDDVFDLLDDLESSEAVLVIDAQGRLIGIITTFDTTAYLRQRAQDIMVVQEIEEMIKSYINVAFTPPGGEIDADKQQVAIADITPSNSALKGKFSKALVHYLKQIGEAAPKIDPTALEAAFQAQLHEQASVKPFNKLTLHEYIDLLLHPSRWKTYEPIFALEREAIRRLLDKVRMTRNDLAHFRDDISQTQREELRFAKEWLARHESAINTAFGLVGPLVAPGETPVSRPPDQTETRGTAPQHGTAVKDGQISFSAGSGMSMIIGRNAAESAASTNTRPVPVDEPSPTGDSRYAPLIQMLRSQPAEVERVTLSFNEVDDILGEHRLPDSARKYRAWWANDSVGHAHSQQWLDAGWRVANVNMSEERVIFARNKEHEQRYLTFFNALRAELERAAPHVFQFTPPDGQYWISIGNVYWENRHVAYFYLAFTRTRRFRVELLIDSSNSVANKQIFDALLERKEQIEHEVGESLSWERLDDKRSARIARYYPGTIMDSDGALANLRARVVEATQRFYPALDRYLTLVLPGVLRGREPGVEGQPPEEDAPAPPEPREERTSR